MMLWFVTLILFKLVSVSCCLVTVIVYVFFVPSPAVTTTLTVFDPTFNDLLPVPVTLASLLFYSALTVILDVLYGTVNVYDVVFAAKVGEIV